MDNTEKARIALYVWYAREIVERRAKAEARREARDKRRAYQIYEEWEKSRQLWKEGGQNEQNTND